MPDGHIDDISARGTGLYRPAHELVAKQKPDQAVEAYARQYEQCDLPYLNHFDNPPPGSLLAAC